MNVRSLLLPACFASLAACNATPYQPLPPTPYQQARLDNFIGNRTAGAPTRCISASSGMQIEAVGDVLVAKWGGQLWVNHPQGTCRMADSAGYFLVTEANSTGQYCENLVFKVASSSGGMPMGSCTLGLWTPYTR